MSRASAFVYLPIKECALTDWDLAQHEQTIGESRAMIRESIEMLVAFRSAVATKSPANPPWLVESSAA